MTTLESSHRDLRAALIVAGKRIRKLTFKSLQKNDPTLELLRRVLREARAVAKTQTEK